MAGRCSGCGHTGSSNNVRTHVLTCADYAALFRTRPELCLDPDTEYARHKARNTAEARAALRDQRLHRRFAELERHVAFTAQRWQRPKDILED